MWHDDSMGRKPGARGHHTKDGLYSCSRCHKRLPKTEFNKNASRATGIQSCCRKCQIMNNKIFKKKAAGTEYASYTPEQEAALLSSQNHRCAVCFASLHEDFHLDHCHETGKVRGILCGRCNCGLGYFKRIETLQSALAYLLKSKK